MAARGRADLVVRHGPAALAGRVPADWRPAPGRSDQAKASGRERNFGPPAPPKGKKGKGNFQQKERGPKGPIPTKFTGRMYDLDEVDAPEDAVDEVPEFMKPDADRGRRSTPAPRRDAARSTSRSQTDAGRDRDDK